jgi:phosphoglycerate dehydrogenase-like enzyme
MPDVVLLFKPSIKVPYIFTDQHIQQIEEACAGKVYRFESEKELLDSGISAEILYTWGGTGDMPVEYCKKFAGLNCLKWFHSFSAGMDPVMNSEIADLPILISNSSGIHSKTIAEHTMGFILAHNRTFPFMFQKQREHVWAKGMTRDPVEALGKKIGIVGAGAIGTQIAKRAKAFEMYTIGLRRTPIANEYFDEMLGPDKLDDMISRSDYLVIATPLTAETKHMIDAGRLAKMKNTALLINIARGAVVDEEALIEALRENRIGGAALDVVTEEPLDTDSPLWDFENVMITPHMSADAPILVQFAVDFFCNSIRIYREGGQIPNIMSR